MTNQEIEEALAALAKAIATKDTELSISSGLFLLGSVLVNLNDIANAMRENASRPL
jgi:hypothetical protein